jgi:ATP-binding cassette subfamily B protein
MDFVPLFRRLGRHVGSHAWITVPILVSVLLEMCFYSGLPFSFRYVVDFGLLGRNHKLLWQLVAGMGAGAFLIALASLVRDRLYARLTASLLTELRVEMFEHLQLLSMDFYAEQPAGDIMARFSSDLAVVESATAQAISWAVQPVLDVLAGVVLLLVLDWKLALLALLVFPVAVVGPNFFGARVAEESYRRKVEESRVLSFLQENVTAQLVVKAFGLSDYARQGFRERIAGLRERMVRVGLFSGLVERSALVGIMLLQVAILAAGAYRVSSGHLTVGSLASFQALFLSVSYSLANVMQYVPSLVEALGGMRRVEEFLWRRPRVCDRGTMRAPRFVQKLRFDGVSFGYPSERVEGQSSPCRRSVERLNFEIKRGEYVAVVGASGAGKSTILNLLMRLYDPDTGCIRIDDVDVREIPISELRALIGYVPQESLLFNIPIRENIRLGNLSATEDEIEAAARAAGVHDVIQQLPEGYETLAGERGGLLSGGQRQRIALARALVRNPAILVLDEATSALDPSTEAAILTTLERLRAGRTILFVTHRLNSIVAADRIFVLDHGEVAEQGSHVRLMANHGLYREMWEKQTHSVPNESRRLVSSGIA